MDIDHGHSGLTTLQRICNTPLIKTKADPALRDYLQLAPMLLNHIKKFRENKGITQQQLADAVGVSRQTIVAIEKGNYTPSLLLAFDLADFFKLTTEKLFSRKK